MSICRFLLRFYNGFTKFFANVFTKVLRRFLLRFTKIVLMLLRRCMFTKVLLRSFPDGFSEGVS